MGGSDTEADYPNCRAGVYGTQGVPAPSNMPGARTDAVGWTDSSGNLWLFGGLGFASESAEEVGGLCHGPDILNDLWKYSPATSMWTWISGSNIFSQLGTYGTLGTAAPGNVPGARGDAVAWTDTTGNLWLFGGEGNDSNGTLCENGGGLACDLNDLWKYTPATNMWTWLGGPNLIAQPGRYGTQGVAAPSNIPGARWLAVGWTDAAGDFWLFGGEGFDSVGTGAGVTDLNDLWKYSGGQWTWMSGSDIANQLGTYGTQGTADPGNSPGAREAPAAWIDPSGNLGSSADTPSGCYPRESSTTCGCTTHKGRAVTPLIGLEGTSVTFLTGCGNGMGKGSPLTLGGPLSGRTAVFINR